MFIVRTVYNIIIFCLLPIIFPLGYLVAIKRKEDKDYPERFGAIKIPQGIKQSVWIHCASVGEVRSINNLVNKIRVETPNLSIAISTTTSTGKAVAQQELMPDIAFLMPLENSMAISMLIDAMNCKTMFIVDTELWPNTIYTAARKTKLVMINGRISDRSFKSYKRLKFIFKPILNKFDYIFAKSDDDVKKLSFIKGSDSNIENAGNLKFNFELKQQHVDVPAALKGKKIAMAACTHENEEALFLSAIQAAQAEFDHIVLAPRHLNRVNDTIKAVEQHNLTYSLLSETTFATKVTIVDSFGQLEKFYSLADKIFIGGSMNGTGGHNIFEAIQFHKVPAVGPNMHNFKEIYDLATKHHAVITVNDASTLSEYLTAPIDDITFEPLFSEIAEKNKSTLKIVSLLKGNIDD